MQHGGTPPNDATLDALDVEDLLHPEEQRQFRQLSIETSADELADLSEVVALHVDQVQALAGDATDVDTAIALGTALRRLLGAGISFSAEQRRHIRGAIEYFLLTDDADGDLDHPLGFDDDLRVVNAALHRIGHPEFAVEAPS